MYAEVLIELKAAAVDRTFTYKIEEPLQNIVKEGTRVLVPFGKQKLEGFVLKIKNEIDGDYKVKSILSCREEEPILNAELLKLGSYISKSTISTKISAYQTMLPTALKAKKDRVISKKYQSFLILRLPIDSAYLKCTTQKQKDIICLFEGTDKIEKKEAIKISVSSVATLLKNQVVEEIKEEVYRLKREPVEGRQKHKLTSSQRAVKEEVLQEKRFKPFLLHGITGSGKTEVYMDLIEEILKEGKQALVLVPEISLTPQFLSKFRNRFGDSIAVLHSHLSSGEKYDEWRKIEREEVSIVVGARSAVFAPFRKLGIIILDEEHSPSYKQENRPRYHAIDIALFRGKYHNCPVLLGSATPSIESYTRAQAGIYTLLELKDRVTGTLPKVMCIDMREEIKKGYSLFSKPLEDKINQTLADKKQVILLLNRRGYSTIRTCSSCGYTDTCPHCEIPLVYHKASKTMRCHYCGYGKSVLKGCPSCHSIEINSFGMGTQKLEEEINKKWKKARILRMDADTTTTKYAYEEMVRDFEKHQYDILIGTQMIAKGLDFENVDFVGVLHADASLQIPDFRSGERTFALLSQVAGRAGRKEDAGVVIFQGFNMNHYSIIAAQNHDYKSFYKEEMRLRKLLGYPPYYNLSVIEIRAKNEQSAIEESKKISSFLDRDNKKVTILGPAPATIPKINDYYIFKILLKYKRKEDIMKKMIYLYDTYKTNRSIQVEIDLNPTQI